MQFFALILWGLLVPAASFNSTSKSRNNLFQHQVKDSRRSAFTGKHQVFTSTSYRDFKKKPQGVARMTLDEVQELPKDVDTLEQSSGKGAREDVDPVRATPDESSLRLEEEASHSTSVTSLAMTRDHIHWGYNWTSSASLESWLVEAEQKYGGLVDHVRCMRGFRGGSAHSKEEGGRRKEEGEHFCVGGDRMARAHHNYAHCYAQVFDAYRERWSGLRSFLIAEVGILDGSGVAMWSQLFPHAEVHGFDLDLTNTRKNLPFLRARGAFAYEGLRLHSMNQLEDNGAFVGSIAQTSKFSLVMDDGLHTDAAIEKTFASFKPYLGEDFVYIVEDVTDQQAEFVSTPNAAFQAWQCPGTKAGQLWVLTSKTNGFSGESPNLKSQIENAFPYIFWLVALPFLGWFVSVHVVGEKFKAQGAANAAPAGPANALGM